MPQAKIFQGKITPQSIKQGFLGDCYFLAGIAALAERPDRISNLFLLHEKNLINFYLVKMLYKGKKEMVDDRYGWLYSLYVWFACLLSRESKLAMGYSARKSLGKNIFKL